MIKLKKIHETQAGRRVNYEYEISSLAAGYLKQDRPLYVEYETDVSIVPEEIKVIPFLCNIMPLAWFVGFDVYVDKVDSAFVASLEKLKQRFSIEWPEHELGGELICSEVVTSNRSQPSDKQVVYFSGGVDGYATLIRNLNPATQIVTVLGADVDVDDQKQWQTLQNHRKSEPIAKNLPFQQVTANLRTFYQPSVNQLLPGSWWGQVQHGMALLGVSAPLSHVENVSKIIIASSYTKEIQIAWGSSPYLDELIKWANVSVVHDGYELGRQDKVSLIAGYSKAEQQPIKVRVCYSELNQSLNCSRCEKCYRTIFGLILEGANPNQFGFQVEGSFYTQLFGYIRSCKTSDGMRHFWRELSRKAKLGEEFFVLQDQRQEALQIRRIANGEIDQILEKIASEGQVKSFLRRLPARVKGRLVRTER